MNIVDFIRNPPSRFSFLTNQAIVHTSVKNQTDLPSQKKSINIKKKQNKHDNRNNNNKEHHFRNNQNNE
jgi:hypothetical protein